MATITIEVTDLVERITAFQDEHDMSDRAVGLALSVSKNSLHNWRSGREMTLTPELQQNIALLMRISPKEVLQLHGYDVSDDIPATVADSPRSPQLEIDATSNVADLDAARERRASPAPVVPITVAVPA